MRFDDDSIDFSGVDDRRGPGGGGLAVGGGGLGILGLLAYLVLGVLGGEGSAGGGFGAGLGGVPGGLSLNGQSSASSRAELEQRCREQGAFERYTDCFLIKTYNVADDVWTEEFSRRGLTYRSPRLAFFSHSVNTSCGGASAAVGPFYCPADSTIYFDLQFLQQLQSQLGAGGDFAQAYIVAHEFGHHLQNLLGTERAVRRLQRSSGAENAYSVAMELQADCYAGAWAALADSRDDGIVIEPGDIDEGLTAAAAVGDDAIQRKSGGSVDQESFTHGSSADRVQWFRRGMQSADPGACATFQAAGLPL